MITAGQSGVGKSGVKALLSILLTTVVALLGILVLTVMHHPGHMDFIEYWSSGRLIAQHLNPYSSTRIFALEKAAGATYLRSLVMPNPPWTLILVAPLGFTSVYVGLYLWMIATVGCVVASMLLLNRHVGYGPLALLFAPVLICLQSGQSSPFLLLGFSLFLYFHRERPFVAGASLLLMAIKPHLFLVFWAVLLADCIYRRAYRVLAGGIFALVAANACALCFDLHVWQHYWEIIHGYHYNQDILPTAAMLFRALIDIRAFWLLFVPSILAIAWALWYYFRWKQVWDWKIHGMLLMLVTIFVSPYGFFSDEIVLLPSIIFALSLSERRKYSVWILLAINAADLAIMFSGPSLASRDYIWTPASWLLWFLYATNGFRQVGRQGVSSAVTVPNASPEGA